MIINILSVTYYTFTGIVFIFILLGIIGKFGLFPLNLGIFGIVDESTSDRGFEPMNPFTGLSLESSCFNHLHKRIDWSMDTDEVNTDYTMNLSNSCTYDNIQIGSDSPFAGK